MTDRTHRVDAVIVGAGLAGLMAARVLKGRGIDPLLLEQGEIGGRLATMRIGPGKADTGAQFFTVREESFREVVAGWQADGLIYEWSRGWSDGSLHRALPDGHPRYAAHGGMMALAVQLASKLNVESGVTVTHIERDDATWRVYTSTGACYLASGVVITAPVPLALTLLKAGEVMLPLDTLAVLDGIAYAPSLTGVFWLEGAFYMPSPGAIQRRDMPVQWLVDNQRKGISPLATVVTVQTSPERSRTLWHEPAERVLAMMHERFALFMGPRAVIRERQLRRWKYALPEVIYGERCLIPEGMDTLVLAGDAFGGPRVEGAALSGMTAGDALANRLSSAAASA